MEAHTENIEPTPLTDIPAGSTKPASSGKKRILMGVSLVLLVVAALGFQWWLYLSGHEETDNATLAGDVHPISARVNGTVMEVPVLDNQPVAAGQVLLRLDPRDFQVQVQQAEAALAVARQQAKVGYTNINLAQGKSTAILTQAKGGLGSASAAIGAAQATVTEAKAGVTLAQRKLAQEDSNLKIAQSDYSRYQSVDPKAISQRQLESARNQYEVVLEKRNVAQQELFQANARLAQALKQVTSTQSQFLQSQGGLQEAQTSRTQVAVQQNQYEAALSQVKQAEANVAQAKLNLSYTTLLAPVSGRVGHKTVEGGQRVQVGQPLMAVVQDNVWVIANFKETQLGRIKVGQPVEIKVDAFAGHPFEGRVQSIAPGSGALFALLPPDNATGNFTKIVQRVPVKVTFLPKSLKGYAGRLVPGMSAVVSIQVK